MKFRLNRQKVRRSAFVDVSFASMDTPKVKVEHMHTFSSSIAHMGNKTIGVKYFNIKFQ